MTNPASADSQTKEATTFADKVNEAVAKATVDDSGNLVLPEGLSEEVAYSATLEKRRRDTQSSYTKVSQTNKALEAEKAALIKKVGKVELQLTPEQTAELENLKFEDPEAWRKKMNFYESEAVTKRTKEIDEELKQVSKSTLDNEELESRKATLEEFNQANPDVKITDSIIASDIPPRIVKKLESGQVTFDQFLVECRDYLKTGKVVKQDDVLKQPNLGKIAGGHTPENNAVEKDVVLSYAKETY